MVNAFGMSTVVVTTRKMQKIHYTVVLLSYAIFGAIILSFGLLIEAIVIGEFRFANYSLQSIGMMVVASLFNSLALSF